MTDDLIPFDEYKAKKAPSRFKPIKWADVGTFTETAYLVKGLLPAASVSVVFGEPGCGKSFLCADLGYHVALGQDWQGRRVKQGLVVYVAAEGGEIMKKRTRAFQQEHGLESTDTPFYLIPSSICLLDDRDVGELLAAIRLFTADMPCSLVVIDTLARAMAGGDENSPGDMGRFVRAVDRIKDETGAHVLVVHHSGKESARGARGHSSLKGATDIEIEVTHDEFQKISTATIRKHKDGEAGAEHAFKLKRVVLGVDQDGDEIDSCVVEPSEAQEKPKGRVISDRDRRAFQVLLNCLVDVGEIPPASKDIPANVRAVKLDYYREQLTLRDVIKKDAANPRKDYSRIRDSLINHNLVGIFDDWIWSAKQGV